MAEKMPEAARAAPAFPRTEPEAAFGILRGRRQVLSIEDMDLAIEAEARRRHGRPESLHSPGRGRKVPKGGDETAED